MSEVTTDDIDALIAQFRDIRTDIMRDNAHGIQACKQLVAPIPYMDATRVVPPSSDSSTPFPATAPFVPSGQPDSSTQPSMPSSTPAHCPPLVQLGPDNWTKVLEVLSQAISSPGATSNSTAVFHLQSAILSLASDPPSVDLIAPT